MYPGMGGNIPVTSTMFQWYASVTRLMMMMKTVYHSEISNQFQVHVLPHILCIFNLIIESPFGKYCRQSILGKIYRYFLSPTFIIAPNTLTLAIKEYEGSFHNQVFEAAETFLNTKKNPTMKGLQLSKLPKDKRVNITINKRSQVIEDDFEGIKLNWSLVGGFGNATTNRMQQMPMHGSGYSQNSAGSTDNSPTRFELTFEEKYYETVVESYIPYILKKAKELNDENKTLKLHGSGGYSSSRDGGGGGGGVNLQHPSTFQTLAMDDELKEEIIDDLDRFVKRRDFYARVGKAWKRGYLLYGPPGTGKSSLVAAMANYLNFDVYDLELTNVHSNSQLRSVLLGTKNRSILLIEDIDCSAQLQDRNIHGPKTRNTELTLSGLLNVIDGIWSSCGDEKIIIFTTNHKEKLDPALLRPGRMDKHIHMSYITPQGFRILASNYICIDKHHLFGEIDELLLESQTTPAEVAEQLMVSDDPDVSLNGLTEFLKKKILKAKQLKEEEARKELYKEEKDQKETKDEKRKKGRSSNNMCSECGSFKPPGGGVYPHAPMPYNPAYGGYEEDFSEEEEEFDVSYD
ncbi:hypothetical protein MKX03_027987 [Papaver bracteatum]|nr:hypothetical protein MKX03_027987 [Papaver bracteatum]